MNMSFSVVIATLGRPDRLRRALEAVNACDPAPLEVIVVDGDDAGSARPVVEAFGGAIRWMVSERGSSVQRNRGIDACTGDVVVFFDDDARPEPDVFAHLSRAYVDPNVVGATGFVDEPGFGRTGGKQSALRRLLFRGPEGRFTSFGYPRHLTRVDREIDVEFMQGCFLTARRPEAASVRFDEQLPGYALAEDEDFSYRLSRLGRIRYLPQAVVHHDNAGFGSRDHRAFGRLVMVNRTYLLRKNFPLTPTVRLQFGLLFLVFVAHRIVNREWAGVRGLVEGAWQAWRTRPVVDPGRPPRVAFVTSHALLGGAETYLEILLHELGPEWRAGVVVLQEGPSAARLPDPVMMPTSASRVAMARSALRLRLALRRMQPDVVHANGVKAAAVAAAALVGTRIPLVWVKHDFSWDRRLAPVLARRCAEVVGVSEAVLGAVPPGVPTSVVPPGMDPPAVDRGAARAAVEALMGPPCATVVALVGRFHSVKGHVELLAALPDLLARRPEARVLFLGAADSTEPEQEEVVRRAAAAAVADGTVVMAGHRSDAVTLVAGVDVLVVPSVVDARGFGLEGSPFAAIEAMAVGTPVVAYAAGGLPGLLGDCGALVPLGDRAALASTLADVLDDDARRARMAACGRARAAERHSAAAMADGLRAVYRRTAAAGRPVP